MSPIQPTRSYGDESPLRAKLVLRKSSLANSITSYEAGSSHSFTSPTEPVLPTTPTKKSSLKSVSATSPFKSSPSRAARLLAVNSKRGDPREGLFSRFERNELDLAYLNQTNVIAQAKDYIIAIKNVDGTATHGQVSSPTRTLPAAASTSTFDSTNPFSAILQQARESIGTTANPASDPLPSILRDPADPAATDRKKSAAQKQVELLEASLKRSRGAVLDTPSTSQYAQEKARAEAMTDPAHFYHALLRPCIIQILRAAGYHASKPSVVDALTDLAAKYMMTMATRTVNYAELMRNTTVVEVQDVRMAMSDLGMLSPEMMIEDEILLPEGEDMRGVESFLEWAMGKENKEIRRVALEGGGEGGGGVDFLTALMRKHDNVEGTDGTSRWDGTVLGKMLPPHEVVIEGHEITSIKEWNKVQARKNWAIANGKATDDPTTDKDKTTNSTRQSSELSDLAEDDIEDVEMEGTEAV